jgi:hypothetical protein
MNTFDPQTYLDAAAAALELPIPATSRAAVVGNLMRMHALAQELLAFKFPEDALIAFALSQKSPHEKGPA